jgi:cysteine desulfurase/selenocysteine lyase
MSIYPMKERAQALIKKEFAHLDTLFFNSAYFGPSPYRAKQKVSNALFKELDPSFFPYNTWIGIPDRIRKQIAHLLNVPTASIAHSTSVTDIINMIANSYPLKSNDVIVCCNGDYPSNVLPWMMAQKNAGAKLELWDDNFPTVEKLKKNLPKNTKIFDISHVAFDSGRKINLIELGKFLKSRDIFFIVDSTQSLGGEAIDPEALQYIDVLAVSSYKWMLGPYGHAFGYYSQRAIEALPCTSGNWINSPNSKEVSNLLDYTTDTLPGARKFDRGQAPNMLTMSCLEASLEVLTEIGLTEIENYNHSLRDYFLENFPRKKFEVLTPKDAMGNILSIESKGSNNASKLEAELKYRNIDVSVRQGKVRLSFNFFNTQEQVNTLIEALDSN